MLNLYVGRFHNGSFAYDGVRSITAEDFATAVIRLRDDNSWHNKLLWIKVCKPGSTEWEIAFEDSAGWVDKNAPL